MIEEKWTIGEHNYGDFISDDYEPLNEEGWGFIHGDGIGSEFTGA